MVYLDKAEELQTTIFGKILCNLDEYTNSTSSVEILSGNKILV